MQSRKEMLRSYRRRSLPDPFTTADRWYSKKRYLLSAGFGAKFQPALTRLRDQAEKLGWFSKVWCVSESSEELGLPEFLQETAELRCKYPRGFGLWSWKPFLVWKALSCIEEGAHLYYVDAGCELSKLGEPRLKYIDRCVSEHEGVFFILPFLERSWTKYELLSRYHSIVAEGRQIQATWFALSNTPLANDLALKWWAESSKDNFAALMDPVGRRGEDPAFIAHRHDQSVLSCVVKSHPSHFLKLEWEDFFSPCYYVRNSWVLLEPVHALRSRKPKSAVGYLAEKSSFEQAVANSFDSGALFEGIVSLKMGFHFLRDSSISLLARIRG